MSVEENKAVARRYWEAFNAHTLDTWDEVCTPDFKSYDMPGEDRAGVKQAINNLIESFPDVSSSEDDLLTDGDKVVIRRTFQGTHQGSFNGVAATGKPVTFSGIFIHRIAEGLIQEQWAVVNIFGLMEQLHADSPSG
jgi:predicted ester cyclase